MKTCFKCSRELPLSEFYRHPQMGDGHLNKCKECAKTDSRQHYWGAVGNPAWLEAQRKRGRDKYARLYSNPRPIYAGSPEQKSEARYKLGNAVRDGRVIRPGACQDCGVECRPHGHHTDYLKALDVMWLCTKCHARQHVREEAA